MADPADLYAVLAEFDAPERLVDAAKAVRARGFRRLDAFTPYPVDGLAEALGFRSQAVPIATLAGGIVGALTGYLMQVATNLDYPLWVGGRPLIAPPAFVLITFELLVLGAVLGGIGAMFVANRLPRLNHPIFDADSFDLAAPDRFFLAIMAGEGFDRNEAGKALTACKPRAIIDVPGNSRR